MVYVHPMSGIVTSGKAATLRQAKADFQRNWDAIVGSIQYGLRRQSAETQGGAWAAGRENAPTGSCESAQGILSAMPAQARGREQANAAPYQDGSGASIINDTPTAGAQT